MSEPAVKRPMVDLDEFERRLHRPASSVPHKEDPLAELARLVGGHEDPFKAVFDHERAPGQARREPQPLHYPEAVPHEPHIEPQFGANDFRAHDFRADEYPMDEAQLHGTIHPAAYAEPVHQAAAPAGAARRGMTQQELQQAEEEAWYGAEAPAATPLAYHQGAAARSSDMPRSRRPLFITAALVAIGVMGIGASFAYKSSSNPGQIATIKAPGGPVKVQPDQPGGVDVPNQDVSILDKSQQPVPTGVASHEEQPVDLAHQAVSTVPPSANLSPTSAASGAASVPVPPPPPANGQTRSVGQTTYQSYGIGSLIEPKKVKTVSVRSDGTLLPNDKPPQMPDSTAAAPAAPRVVAQNTDASKQTTPKSTARVISMTKPAAPQSIEQLAEGADTPAEAAPAPAKPKPVASTPKPTKVASLDNAQNLHDTPPATGAGGGGFAVQFAAPASEKEAHELTSKLGAKYGAQLSGHRLTYHRVKVNDKDVYRVRTGGLSQSEAASLCEKVKSGGGSCFVARD